jgi:hypothetical protein
LFPRNVDASSGFIFYNKLAIEKKIFAAVSFSAFGWIPDIFHFGLRSKSRKPLRQVPAVKRPFFHQK